MYELSMLNHIEIKISEIKLANRFPLRQHIVRDELCIIAK